MTRTATSSPQRRRAKVPDDYLALVKRFPLRPLRSQSDYTAASQILDRYIGLPDLTRGERDYLEALSHFFAAYERKLTHSRLRQLTPLELLKHLMEENQMTTSDLGRLLGSRGLASEILHAKRSLSKSHISKLASHFHLNPAFFLETP